MKKSKLKSEKRDSPFFNNWFLNSVTGASAVGFTGCGRVPDRSNSGRIPRNKIEVSEMNLELVSSHLPPNDGSIGGGGFLGIFFRN